MKPLLKRFQMIMLLWWLKQKTKFPNARLIVSGLPPQFPDEETRCKVKDFNQVTNQVTKDWCRVNDMPFVDNIDYRLF